jgi:hypothetical protein
MRKMSNDHVRTETVRVRMSKLEKKLAKKLASGSNARTLSSYSRAAILSRPPEDRTIFHKILEEQIKTNALLQAAHDCRAKERALVAAEDMMLWAMKQR